MATLDIRRTYADASVLFASDLDVMIDDIETLVNITRLDDDNIQNQGITASTKLVDASITAGKIASNAVTTTKLIDDAVTTPKIINDAVTTPKIIDEAVTAPKIGPDAVTTPKIINAAVTTPKLATGAVTRDKIAALGHQLSSSCGTFSTISGSYVDVTNLTCTITTTGRPVMAMLVSDGSTGGAGVIVPTDSITVAYLKLDRSGTAAGVVQLGTPNLGAGNARWPASSIQFFDTPAAGTYTYKIQLQVIVGGGTTTIVAAAKLLVFEIG